MSFWEIELKLRGFVYLLIRLARGAQRVHFRYEYQAAMMPGINIALESSARKAAELGTDISKDPFVGVLRPSGNALDRS